MCFQTVVSCVVSCRDWMRDPYVVGMEYKRLCEQNPLYGRIKRDEGVHENHDITFNTYLNNVRYYLAAAAKKGNKIAQQEFDRFEEGLYKPENMGNAAHNGHAAANRWFDWDKIIKLEFEMNQLQLEQVGARMDPLSRLVARCNI